MWEMAKWGGSRRMLLIIFAPIKGSAYIGALLSFLLVQGIKYYNTLR